MDILQRRRYRFTVFAGFIVALLTAPTLASPDLNADGIVNIYDLSLAASCFGSDPSVLPQCAIADLTEDGAVTMDDIDLVVSAFGQVTTPNTVPSADAGPDQLALVGDTITLDGSGSSDLDGDPLSFIWSLIEAPLDSEAVLAEPTSVNPTFTVDLPGNYTVQLVVNDGKEDSAPDIVVVSTGNSPPVADAGADQLVFVGETATLNGSESSDIDGDTLNFLWTLISVPDGSGAALSDPSAVNPTIDIDLPGAYEVRLVVNDGITDSAPDTVTIATDNSAPVADAGADQLAQVGDTITLDGSASSDVDSDELTFSWALTSVPSGSAAALNDTTSVKPTFVIDVSGAYVAQLIVNDGLVDSAPDTVVVATTNTAPVADAGDDQSLRVGDTAFLDGGESYDVDDDELAYFWSFVSVPEGSLASLSDPMAIVPSFDLDASGDYVAQLIVNDGTSDSAPDTVTISTVNTTPIADAGADQTVLAGSVVTLEGSASVDADGDALTYAWSFIVVPAGSGAVISDLTAVAPTFNADLPGTYVVQLIVNDGTVSSAPDSATISATEGNTAPIAAAGDDQTVLVGETASLSGTGSTDPDGDILTYDWTLVAAPATSAAALVGATTATPSLTPDAAGDYVIALTVNDGEFDSAPDTVTVAAGTPNTAPVADAGDDQTVLVGETASLSGTGSTDPDGDILTYDWTLVAAPATSAAALVGATTATPSLTPDAAGDYVIALTVNDGEFDSAPDTVTVAATAPASVVANNDLGSTFSDLAATLSVLDNDTPSGALTVDPASITQPANGEVTLNADNTITYRQAGLAFEADGLNLYRSNCSTCHGIPGFSGTDTFTYGATDGVSSDTASVTMNVTSFDALGIDISGRALTICASLPSIRQHSDCLGLTDGDIRTIGDFLNRAF